MEKVCILFPYSMGEDFLSGGVGKLVLENLIISVKKYETHLILPINNKAFKVYIEKNIPNVIVHLTDFEFMAQYADTANKIKRIFLIFKSVFKTLIKKKNLEKEILLIKPDIVHLHAEVSFVYLKLIKEKGIKTIFHASSLRFAENKFLKNIVVNNVKKYADCVISPTNSIGSLYSNKNKYIIENPIVIPKSNGNFLIEKEILSDKRLKLVYTGRICRVKQIHYLIQAFLKLPKESLEKISLYVIGKPNNAGDEEYFADIKKLINKKLENIYFLGYKSNVQEYLKYMDVGVLLSKSEAISMSSVEYMFSGLAVIGFNNPGINEVVIDNYNGFLVDDPDIEKLKESILTCIYQKDKLLALKNNAKKYAYEHFSRDVFEKKLLSVYEEFI